MPGAASPGGAVTRDATCSRPFFVEDDAGPEASQRPLRVREESYRRRRGFEMSPGAAAAPGFRFAETGADQSLFLEPPQRQVDRRAEDWAPRVLLEFCNNGDAVAVRPQPDDGEQNEVLEFPERFVRHPRIVIVSISYIKLIKHAARVACLILPAEPAAGRRRELRERPGRTTGLPDPGPHGDSPRYALHDWRM
jgi:hypothetical protein